MKLKKSYTSIFAATALTLGAIATMILPSSGQRTTTFLCGTSNDGTPTTFARTATGKRIAIIRWERQWGDGREYTPESRCDEVSARFQKAHENDVLNYLTSEKINGYPVVCAAPGYGDPCSQILFTLRQNDNANEVIQSLIGYQAVGPIIQSEDGEPQTFIDMNKLLRQAPAEEEY